MHYYVLENCILVVDQYYGKPSKI